MVRSCDNGWGRGSKNVGSRKKDAEAQQKDLQRESRNERRFGMDMMLGINAFRPECVKSEESAGKLKR